MNREQELIAKIASELRKGHYDNPIIESLLKEYAKERAVEFFKFNILKIDEYVDYSRRVSRAEGITQKHIESDRYEGAPINIRYDIYMEEQAQSIENQNKEA